MRNVKMLAGYKYSKNSVAVTEVTEQIQRARSAKMEKKHKNAFYIGNAAGGRMQLWRSPRLAQLATPRDMSRIYIGKIGPSITEDRLRETFAQFGEITNLEVKNGYAHLGYVEAAAAGEAIAKMNGSDLDGSALIVDYAKENKHKVNKRFDLRVIVDDLDARVSWQDLKDWAREAGDVTFTNVFDKDGRHYGVVEYKVGALITGRL